MRSTSSQLSNCVAFLFLRVMNSMISQLSSNCGSSLPCRSRSRPPARRMSLTLAKLAGCIGEVWYNQVLVQKLCNRPMNGPRRYTMLGSLLIALLKCSTAGRRCTMRLSGVCRIDSRTANSKQPTTTTCNSRVDEASVSLHASKARS